MAAACWWYYLAKFTEFFDTIFFNLRKKTEHVSTLHVIHHGCMPFSVWLGVKFAAGKITKQLNPSLKFTHNIQCWKWFSDSVFTCVPQWDIVSEASLHKPFYLLLEWYSVLGLFHFAIVPSLAHRTTDAMCCIWAFASTIAQFETGCESNQLS